MSRTPLRLRRPGPVPAALALGCALALSLVCGAGLGSVSIAPERVLTILVERILQQDAGPGDAAQAIVWGIRVPRLLLAALVGAGLSMAGAAFQGLLRNPLADPYLLGVSSGCALGAIVVILLGWHAVLGAWSLPLFAFGAGIAALLIVARVAALAGPERPESLVLAGVVVNASLGALVSLLLILDERAQAEILHWLLGSLSLKGWDLMWTLLPYVFLCGAALWALARPLDLLALGDRQAHHTGLDVARQRRRVMWIASLVTAACVSVAGPIGFVGLAVPHLVRLVMGPGHRALLPLSGLTGAVLLLWGDILARTAAAPAELPLGVLTALLGGPFFLWLLLRGNRT